MELIIGKFLCWCYTERELMITDTIPVTLGMRIKFKIVNYFANKF